MRIIKWGYATSDGEFPLLLCCWCWGLTLNKDRKSLLSKSIAFQTDLWFSSCSFLQRLFWDASSAFCPANGYCPRLTLFVPGETLLTWKLWLSLLCCEDATWEMQLIGYPCLSSTTLLFIDSRVCQGKRFLMDCPPNKGEVWNTGHPPVFPETVEYIRRRDGTPNITSTV